MKKIFITLTILFLAIGAQAQTASKHFIAPLMQNFDPDPRKEGRWRIGETIELDEPVSIEWSRNFIKIATTDYFIDKSSLEDKDYTMEENANFSKSVSFTAQDNIGTQVYVCIEYAHRENPKIFGFSIFEQNRLGRYYIAQRVKEKVQQE